MCTSRWYKKFFLPKNLLLSTTFSSSSFPIPSQIPIFPISLPSWPCIPKFSRGYARTQPPSHPPIFVGLRPSASGLHRRAPCRFVDSGKRGKGRRRGKREKGRENPYYLPPHHNPNPRRAGQSQRAPPRQHIYNFHFIIIIDCLL